MTSVLVSNSSAVNPTVVLISVGLPLLVCGAIAVIVWSYFRLQAHRADAIAMADYRQLAEEAVANQQEPRAELARLTQKIEAVEQLMRDIG